MTGNMRRVVTLLLDTFSSYYAFSRAITDKRRLVDVMAGLCLSAIVVAPLALFESLRGWLLYTGINDAWGSSNMFAWLLRGDSLRSMLSTGSLDHDGVRDGDSARVLAVPQTRCQGSTLELGRRAAALHRHPRFVLARGLGDGAVAAGVDGLSLAYPLRRGVQGARRLGVVAGVIYASPFGSRIVDLLPSSARQTRARSTIGHSSPRRHGC